MSVFSIDMKTYDGELVFFVIVKTQAEVDRLTPYLDSLGGLLSDLGGYFEYSYLPDYEIHDNLESNFWGEHVEGVETYRDIFTSLTANIEDSLF